jgi:hypothetical protein
MSNKKSKNMKLLKKGSTWRGLRDFGITYLLILPLKSQHIYSVLLFVLKNRKLFTTNYDAHNLQTRRSNNLYLPTSTFTLYQKGAYFTSITLFNNLPLEIKEIVGLLIVFMTWRNITVFMNNVLTHGSL